jgi:hypothetical protein
MVNSTVVILILLGKLTYRGSSPVQSFYPFACPNSKAKGKYRLVGAALKISNLTNNPSTHRIPYPIIFIKYYSHSQCRKCPSILSAWVFLNLGGVTGPGRCSFFEQLFYHGQREANHNKERDDREYGSDDAHGSFPQKMTSEHKPQS